MTQLSMLSPMKRTSFARMHCSLARELDLIGDWWSPLMVHNPYLGVVRFDDLVEDLGISRNILTRRLNALSKNGIVERHAYQRRPFRYEYRLSEAGRDLVPAILALTAWGDRWARPPLRKPDAVRAQNLRPELRAARHLLGLRRSRHGRQRCKRSTGPGGAMKTGTRVLARRLGAKG